MTGVLDVASGVRHGRGLTAADRMAEALRRTRPRTDGPEMRQWSDDVVTVARTFAALAPLFDRGDFLTRRGGL